MLKGIGLLCLIAACTAVGFHRAGTLRRSVISTRLLVLLLQDLQIHIRYQSLPLEELLGLLAAHPNYQSLGFLKIVSEQFRPTEAFADLWQAAVREDGDIHEAAKAILCQLGNVLGTTDTAGQMTALALHVQQMQALETQLDEGYQKKGSLYQKLGILTGVMLAMLLC